MDILTDWASYFVAGEIGRGLLVTLQAWIVASAVTVVWALAVVVARMSPIKPLQWLAVAYIEFFRGTPFLVQLLTFFAAVPMVVGFFLPPFQTAILALTLNAGGYLAEGYRSGLQAVPLGQREAAVALGMNNVLVFWRVVLPQAFRIFLPAIGNSVAGILLSTPFVFMVGLQDMMMKANYILSKSGDFSVYLLIVVIYAILGLLIVSANSWVERRLQRGL